MFSHYQLRNCKRGLAHSLTINHYCRQHRGTLDIYRAVDWLRTLDIDNLCCRACDVDNICRFLTTLLATLNSIVANLQLASCATYTQILAINPNGNTLICIKLHLCKVLFKVHIEWSYGIIGNCNRSGIWLIARLDNLQGMSLTCELHALKRQCTNHMVIDIRRCSCNIISGNVQITKCRVKVYGLHNLSIAHNDCSALCMIVRSRNGKLMATLTEGLTHHCILSICR